MQPGGIQQWKTMVFGVLQKQRQFGSAKDQPFDRLLFPEFVCDCQQTRARFSQENAFNQFVHVFAVNVGLVLRFGQHQLARDQQPVILNGGFRSNSTDDAQRFHRVI